MPGFGSQGRNRPDEGSEDLLAQREAEEFEASVRAARWRASAPQQPRPAPVTPDPDEGEIEWSEQPDVYRPRQVDARDVLRALGVGAAVRLSPGEPVALIRRSAMERLAQHLRTDLQRELGGLLAGEALYDPALDLHLVLIEAAMPAEHGEATSTSFTYTAAAWASIFPGLVAMNAAWTILGSYHSHPGLGVFLSSVDLDTQAEVFPHDWQIAIVMDPIANACGLFAGASGRACAYHVI
ncbi:MAG TPA: Mov34/MPN/PAD-1 family protein [Chthonomonadaceae bacterium]|nr:Mov34/MPN/PAD-1 family protein [Chthonomonadaceae bacterium]